MDPLPAWAWTLLIIALIGVVLYFGVRVSVRVTPARPGPRVVLAAGGRVSERELPT